MPFDQPSPDFESVAMRPVEKPDEKVKTYRCPCCGYKTLKGRGNYEICLVCYWEDDGQDDPDADIVVGGPNGSLSLTQARANFQQFGAADERCKSSVRPPQPDEI
jgi:Cysteine-rich CPCC